jgi:predicted ribosome quality control (RQC) complex YloA/Tae2 family protein
VLPPVATGVPIAYLDPAAAWAATVGADAAGRRLQAFVAARVSLRFDDSAAGIDERQEYEALFGPLDGSLDLDTEKAVDYEDRDFRQDAPAGSVYVLPSAPIAQPSFFRDAERDIARRLVERQTLDVFRNRSLKLTSRPGETKEQFATRCDEAAQAAADADAAQIKRKLEAKQAKLEAALEIAKRRVSELDTQARARQANELVAGAGAVLGALFGGRRSARSITNAIGKVASQRGMSATVSQRRETAEAKAQQSEDALHEVEQEILDEVQQIDADWKAKAEEIETFSVRPEAADVHVEKLTLLWVPTA